jgi:hypothetical protein
MYYVCFKAMIAALRGARHGWKKLDRTGSVTVSAAESEGRSNYESIAGG